MPGPSCAGGPGTEPWLSQRLREAVAERWPTLTEILNYRRDGGSFRNAVLIAPIFGKDGDVAFFLGSQVDVGDDPRAAAGLA